MDNRQQILKSFINEWPIRRIKEISLEDYALGNNNFKDTFSYWVETETRILGDIGGIGGGGSFKHGIYYMTNKKKFSGNKRINDEDFAWLKKYGNNTEEAFLKIKSLLIEVVEAAQNSDWAKIDEVDFYSPVKWKWAFLYSNKQLFPVYKKEALNIVADKLDYKGNDYSYPILFDYLLKQKTEEQDCFQFGDKVWNIYAENKPCNYYILGSKYGEHADIDVFPEMYNRQVISTGFASTFDLEELVGRSQKEIINFLKEKGEDSKSYSCLKYFLNIKPGDKVAIKADGSPKGSKGFLSIVGIAEVVESEEYYGYEPDALGHTLTIKWQSAPVYKEFEIGGYGRTIHKLSDKNLIKEIFTSNYVVIPNKVKENNTNDMQSNPLNKILYGPPGTGKTYNTINKAISIINPEFDVNQNRKIVKEEYVRLVKLGQIVFTTFHQSMSYEDFIEGIKPVTIEGVVNYEIIDGIFKQICTKALFANMVKGNEKSLSSYNDFDSLFEQYIANIESRLNDINEGDKLLLPLRSKGYHTEIKSFEDDYVLTRGTRANSDVKVYKDKIRLLYNKFDSVNDIKDVSVDVRSVGQGLGWSSNYYGVFQDFKKFEAEFSNNNVLKKTIDIDYTDYKKIKSFVITNNYPEKYESADNFVIIIDEINRGNISQIFGELITLIEDDKRLGRGEFIEANLPYSKESYGVPPNVYIIGTMNTADRSVEALDTALRRRFSFEEIPPDYKLISEIGGLSETKGLIDDIDVGEVLKTINERIELLIDKDHKIGHSYFLYLSDLSSLQKAFKDKVIPLLEEYFFGDFGKISLVLGNSFISKVDKARVSFANGNEYDPSIANDFLEKSIYKINPMGQWDFQSIYKNVE